MTFQTLLRTGSSQNKRLISHTSLAHDDEAFETTTDVYEAAIAHARIRPNPVYSTPLLHRATMQKPVYNPIEYAGYSRAVVIEHPTYKDVSKAGVIATDAEGHIVGKDDMKTQTQRVYENIQTHLNELGGSLEDIIRHQVFVTTMEESAVDAFHEGHMEFFEEPKGFPAGTLIEFDSLVLEDAMIEIEIEAIIPADGWETDVVSEQR